MDMRYERAHGGTEEYYSHGTPAERWERAQLFFGAREYTAAARVLAGLVEETPEQTGPRLLLGGAMVLGGVLLIALRALRKSRPVAMAEEL